MRSHFARDCARHPPPLVSGRWSSGLWRIHRPLTSYQDGGVACPRRTPRRAFVGRVYVEVIARLAVIIAFTLWGVIAAWMLRALLEGRKKAEKEGAAAASTSGAGRIFSARDWWPIGMARDDRSGDRRRVDKGASRPILSTWTPSSCLCGGRHAACRRDLSREPRPNRVDTRFYTPSAGRTTRRLFMPTRATSGSMPRLRTRIQRRGVRDRRVSRSGVSRVECRVGARAGRQRVDHRPTVEGAFCSDDHGCWRPNGAATVKSRAHRPTSVSRWKFAANMENGGFRQRAGTSHRCICIQAREHAPFVRVRTVPCAAHQTPSRSQSPTVAWLLYFQRRPRPGCTPAGAP